MKICITSIDETKESEIDSHFGRCPFFTIAEVNDGKVVSLTTEKNTAADHAHGAGTTAADLVGGMGIDVIISGNFGPKAEEVLSALKIEMVKDSGSVQEVLKKYLDK